MGIACALERQGVQGGLVEQHGTAARLLFARDQLAALGALVLKPPAGPLLLWTMLFAALSSLAGARAALRRIPLSVASLALALPLYFAAHRLPLAGLLLLLALLGLGVLRQPRLWFVGVWAYVGVGIFVATPEKNASYFRHFAVPTARLVAGAFEAMLVE